MILSVFLGGHNGWRFGYGAVAALQWCLVLALAATLRLWGRYEPRRPGEPGQARAGTQLSLISTARQTGVWAAMLSYFFYCAVENTTLLWGASYFVSARGFSTVAAAQAASVFVLGITVGRFLCGFASARLSSSALILGGGALAALGAAGMALLPASLGPAALCVVGLGFAPAYPCMMHETPRRFGATRSQGVISLQMAAAYVGNVCMPPLFGLVAAQVGMWLLPVFLLCGVAGYAACTAYLARWVRTRPEAPQ